MNTTTQAPTKPRATKAPPRPALSPCLSGGTIKDLAQVFKLLSDESRLKILLELGHHGEMHVSAICDMLGQSQPAVSHHLTLLRMAGLVAFRRDGKHNFYRLHSGLVSVLLERFFEDQGNSLQQLQFDDFSLSYRKCKT